MTINLPKYLLGSILLIGSLTQPLSASAVNLGQIDTFEDGTTQNWTVALLGAPHPAPPANVPTGGPRGVDDNFLLLTSLDGGGSGSRLVAINFAAQWAGNYLAEGVTAITMDVNNLGTEELSLRLFLADPVAGPPTNTAFSNEAVSLAAGSGWQSVTFPISTSDLTAGLGNVATLLSNVTELRLYHNPDAGFPGSPIATQLGVDNIKATAVPEPNTLSWFSFTLVIFAMINKGNRRKNSPSKEVT